MAKFEYIMPALRAGKKVRRAGWYMPLDKYSTIQHTIDVDSVLADDWEVVPEPRLVEFETEVVALPLAGGCIQHELITQGLLHSFIGKRVRVRVEEADGQ